jgi:hypothetical protein
MTNYQTEFPEFDLGVAIPAAWDDISWHNDTCPSWCAGFTKEGHIVKVWVDYADPNDREFEDIGRFGVVIQIDGGGDVEGADAYAGNDWDEVLAFVAAHVSSQKKIYKDDGVFGFDHDGFFITDPFTSECGRFEVDPIAFYSLTAEQAEQFRNDE